MSILFVVAFAAAILESTEAADHTVGGNTGWTLPSGASFYSDWAADNTFKQNDVLGEFVCVSLYIYIRLKYCTRPCKYVSFKFWSL